MKRKSRNGENFQENGGEKGVDKENETRLFRAGKCCFD